MLTPTRILRPLVLIAIASAAASSALCHADDAASQPAVEPYPLGEGRPLGKGPAKENSGIVKSRQWPDLYWMHNDSGDEPRIYPVRRDATVYDSSRYPETPGVLIGGAINVDWEDIAVDASGHVIVADFGNNGNDRRDLVLYYLHEPSPDAGRTTVFRKIFFRYPEQREFPAPQEDHNYDAEALFTLGDDLFICTKHRSDTYTRVYRVDVDAADELQALNRIDEFDVRGQVTGADATPDGKRLVLLTYDALWLFDVTDPALPVSGPVSWLPYVGGDDVEAVCFADDDTLLLGAEASARLYEVPLNRFVPYERDAENTPRSRR